MPSACALSHAEAALHARLYACSDDALDALDALAFGVIGFDAPAVVCRHDDFKSQAAGPSLFAATVPCVPGLRMRPARLQLRLLAAPGVGMRHGPVQRPGAGAGAA